ncbi:MAG: hypothetical protein ABEI99_04485 [Halobaculum sp.]
MVTVKPSREFVEALEQSSPRVRRTVMDRLDGLADGKVDPAELLESDSSGYDYFEVSVAGRCYTVLVKPIPPESRETLEIRNVGPSEDFLV